MSTMTTHVLTGWSKDGQNWETVLPFDSTDIDPANIRVDGFTVLATPAANQPGISQVTVHVIR
jgi:hypothetical protein